MHAQIGQITHLLHYFRDRSTPLQLLLLFNQPLRSQQTV
jgi:hypothetical protein